MNQDLWMTFSSEESIRCVHSAIVVKNESLISKYNGGGVKAFINKYMTRFNQDISVMCSMNDQEIDSIVKDLRDHGLVYKKDFAHVDAFSMLLIYGMGGEESKGWKEMQMEVDWLEGEIKNDGVMVTMKGEIE